MRKYINNVSGRISRRSDNQHELSKQVLQFSKFESFNNELMQKNEKTNNNKLFDYFNAGSKNRLNSYCGNLNYNNLNKCCVIQREISDYYFKLINVVIGLNKCNILVIDKNNNEYFLTSIDEKESTVTLKRDDKESNEEINKFKHDYSLFYIGDKESNYSSCDVSSEISKLIDNKKKVIDKSSKADKKGNDKEEEKVVIDKKVVGKSGKSDKNENDNKKEKCLSNYYFHNTVNSQMLYLNNSPLDFFHISCDKTENNKVQNIHGTFDNSLALLLLMSHGIIKIESFSFFELIYFLMIKKDFDKGKAEEMFGIKEICSMDNINFRCKDEIKKDKSDLGIPKTVWDAANKASVMDESVDVDEKFQLVRFVDILLYIYDFCNAPEKFIKYFYENIDIKLKKFNLNINLLYLNNKHKKEMFKYLKILDNCMGITEMPLLPKVFIGYVTNKSFLLIPEDEFEFVGKMDTSPKTKIKYDHKKNIKYDKCEDIKEVSFDVKMKNNNTILKDKKRHLPFISSKKYIDFMNHVNAAKKILINGKYYIKIKKGEMCYLQCENFLIEKYTSFFKKYFDTVLSEFFFKDVLDDKTTGCKKNK